MTEIAEVLVEGALLLYIWERQPLEENTSIYCTDQKIMRKILQLLSVLFPLAGILIFPRQSCVQPEPRVVQ